jgi:hypothetical protein
MSALTVTDVKVEDRGKHKKVVIIMEGLVTEEEANRCVKLLNRPIYERRFDIPLPDTASRL